jgi:hypothetical protein
MVTLDQPAPARTGGEMVFRTPHEATSITAKIRHQSEIAARLVYLREISRTASWEFCNGNLRAIQLLLGHTKLVSTVRYLWIEVDNAQNTAEQIEL